MRQRTRKWSLFMVLAVGLLSCRMSREPDPVVIPVDAHPRLSPDRENVAFVRGYDDSSPSGIYVAGLAGNGETYLLEASAPAWGPDGTTMAVNLRRDIWLVDAQDGTPLRILLSVGSVFGGIDWSKDGRWITYNAPGPDGGIGRVNVSTGEFRVIVRHPARDARWNAACDRIVYESGAGSIGIADSAGADRQSLLTDSGHYSFWSPCWIGDSVICTYEYGDGREGAVGLALISPNGCWRPLCLNGGEPDADEKTGRIVCTGHALDEEPNGATRVFVLRRDGTGRRQMTGRK
jgi:Tol biopolymer transport system component